MEKLRFGIMGAGGIAHHFVRATRLTDCAEVIAVASRDPRRAEGFTSEFGIPACSYEELLEMDAAEAVYIATTHNFHYENIRACLEAGKNVLCEKAMVMHEAQARELFALAKEKGLFLMEAMWSRFLPNIQKARQWIEEGRIGALQTVTGAIGFRCSGDPEHRILSDKLGGGAMYDIGVYATEITAFLVGEPILDAKGYIRRNPRTGVDTAASYLLRFPSVDAALQVVVTSNAKEYIILNGDKGFIEIPTANVGDQCFLYDRERKLVAHFQEPFPGGNGFVYEIRAMADCVRAGQLTCPTVPPEVTVECARVYDLLLGAEG